jgi:hypothetical protein
MVKELGSLEDTPVSGAVALMPSSTRDLFQAILAERDPGLLELLRSTSTPSREQRVAVEDLLSGEFARELQSDYEPTGRGRAIDEVLGQFLMRWPIEPT